MNARFAGGTTLALVFVVAAMCGCRSSKDQGAGVGTTSLTGADASAAAGDAADLAPLGPADHPGPAGGDLVRLNEGALAELLANEKTGEVLVYVWEPDLKKSRPIAKAPLVLGSQDKSVTLLPHPMAHDPPGLSSRFYGQADWMRGGGHHGGWLSREGEKDRASFAWTRCWQAGQAHGSLWNEMGQHPHHPMGPDHGPGHRMAPMDR